MATVERHGHQDELLNGLDIWGERDILDVGEGVEQGGRLEVGLVEVEGGGGRMRMARPAWISKRCCVDIHVRVWGQAGINTKEVCMLARMSCQERRIETKQSKKI